MTNDDKKNDKQSADETSLENEPATALETGTAQDSSTDSASEPELEPTNEKLSGSGNSPELESVRESGSKSSNKGLITVVFLALVALLISGWVGYSQWQNNQLLSQKLSEQNNFLADQKQNIQSLQNALQVQSGEVSKNKEQTQSAIEVASATRQQLAVTQDKLRLLSSQGKQEWLLEQAHYFLTLAQQKIIFEDNLTTAMALLAQAEDTLKKVNDLNLTELRQAISDDITLLSTIPQTDHSTILMKLSSLEKQILQLEPVAVQLPDEQENIPEDNKAWFDRLMITLDNFTDEAVKFRTHDDKVQPLLTDQQKSILQAALQLTLTQAQSAVLEKNTPYFHSRTQFAKQLVEQYFQLDERGSVLSKELNELSSTSLSHDTQIQLESLPLLEQIKEDRRLQWYTEQSNNSMQGDEQ